METTIIPAHTEGKQNDLSVAVTLASREESTDTFKRAYKRLLNPPVWHELAGSLSGEFALVGIAGNELNRLAQTGDLFKVDLPGPGPKAGDGYDWVRVDAIDDQSNEQADEELFAMRISPTINPGVTNHDIAHFFKGTASSTFIIHRKGNEVTASYHGRNEMPNNETGNIIDNIRNSVIAATAAIGLSELQWKSLIKGFLEPEIGG
ncbi:MAG: hypothetical protein ABI581_11505 [Sediminibacterium sp.]